MFVCGVYWIKLDFLVFRNKLDFFLNMVFMGDFIFMDIVNFDIRECSMFGFK